LSLTGCGIGERFLTDLKVKAGRFRNNKQYRIETNIREVAVKVAELTYGSENPNVGISLIDLGKAYFAQRKFSKAELTFSQALKIFILNRGAEHPDTAYTLSHMATVYRKQGKFDKATATLLKVVKIGENIYGSNHRRLIIPNINVAMLCIDGGNYDNADIFFKKALSILELRGEIVSPDFERKIENEIKGTITYYKNNGNNIMEMKFKKQLNILRSSK